MPYAIRKSGDKFNVVKSDTGELVPGGDHKSESKAKKHLAALYANVKTTDNTMKQDILQCRASGVDIQTSQPWAQGSTAQFCYMPAGLHTITAGFRGKAITITVNVTPDTAETVQASFQNLISEAPKQKPFGDIEHEEREASFHPVGFSWGTHLGDEGVICSCEPTALGERNVNGKIHRSFSPSFATDADYSKAKFDGSVYTFPEGVRGSQSNPARITGIDFCVGTLTNKPAFRAMPPVKAKQADTVTAEGTSEGASKGWETRRSVAGETPLETANRLTKEAEASGTTASHMQAMMFHNEMIEKGASNSGYHKQQANIHRQFIRERGVLASSAITADTIRAYETIADMPAPSSGEGQKSYEDLAKFADYRSKVANAADEVYGDGEKHGMKFHKNNSAAMAHKAAAETCPSAEGRAEHQKKAEEHLSKAHAHGKVIASSKATKLTLQAKQAEYEAAKITAEDSGAYADAAKAADLASKVADAHEEVYPDGEKHGTKHRMHAIAAEAHREAEKLAGDNHQIELHSKKAAEHSAKTGEHAKVKAAKAGKTGDVVQAGGPGSGRHKEGGETVSKTSDAFNKSQKAQRLTSQAKGTGESAKSAHEAARAAHKEAHDAHESAAKEAGEKGDSHYKEIHEKQMAFHAEKMQSHENGAKSAFTSTKKLSASTATTASDILAAMCKNQIASKPVTGASVLESIKATVQPVAIAAKSDDSKSILASLAHAKPNN